MWYERYRFTDSGRPRPWKIACDAAIMVEGWAHVPPLVAVKFPCSSDGRINVNNNFCTRRCQGSCGKVKLPV